MLLKIIVVLLFLTFTINTQEAHADSKVCPTGWMNLASSCYYFSTYKTTWSKARSSCQKFGGGLVVPMDNEENKALLNIVKQKGYNAPWIGLVRHQDKKFYTIHGVKPSYTSWNSGEPNNYGGNEDCVHLFANRGGKWNDIPCSNHYHFICQQPILKYKLTCGENKMTIMIPKSLLKVSSASQLQLLDSLCKPQETKLYFYVFTTSLTGCGTTMTSENGGKTVSFHNKVVESSSAFGKSVSRSEEIQFPFKCNYAQSYLVSSSTFGLANFFITPNNASQEDKMLLKMGLYKDQSFTKPLVGDPSLNERLYVEIGLNATNTSSENTSFGIKLNECYVTSKSSFIEYKYLLIERGCQKDKTVTFHKSPGLTRRFSFLVFRFRGLHHYTTHVHCRVSVCEKNDKSCHTGCRSLKEGKRMLFGADGQRIRYFF